MINFSSWSRGTISDETPHAVLMQFIRMEEDRLCKEAQDEVWWEIHRRYSKQIEDHFISLGVSRWDVASLVGELFNRMRTSPPPSDDEVYFRYWCRRVAKQVLIKHWRSLKKTELHVPWPGDQLEDDDKRLHDMAPF